MKKFALKALAALFAIVFLCMFFSNTIKTMTTAKVQIIALENKRFEEKLAFTGGILFENPTEVYFDDTPEFPLMVESVLFGPGEYVKEGDIVLTLNTDGAQDAKAKLKAEYAACSEALLRLDAENAFLPKESEIARLYHEMLLKNAAYNECMFTAMEKGETDASALVALKNAEREKAEAENAYLECAGTLENGEKTLFYILERNALVEKMAALFNSLSDLIHAQDSVKAISAPSSGFISEICCQKGDAVKAGKLFSVSNPQSDPVICITLPLGARELEDGARVQIEDSVYGNTRSKILETRAGEMGRKTVVIEIPDEFLKADSFALKRFMQEGVNVTVTYRAKEATTIVPSSAIRGRSGEEYVYLIQNTWEGILAQKGMQVVKTPVTVIERNESGVSIAEDLAGKRIADREDRPLSDNAQVMEYID